MYIAQGFQGQLVPATLGSDPITSHAKYYTMAVESMANREVFTADIDAGKSSGILD